SQEGVQQSISFSAAFPIPRYLPSGEYVLSTTIDTKTYTKDIFVQPLSRQFERADNQDRNRFSISHQPPQPIPLRVWPQVRDLISGMDITSGSRIEVFWQDRFYPVTLMEQQLFSGQEYSFRIGQRNYYSQEYKKNTSVDQSDLILEVALIPRPGSITLSTEDNKISILLNGHDYYTAGGPRPVRLPIPDLLPGNPLVLNLPPGRYTLEAIGRRDKADIAIQVESGQNRQVMIEYDAEKEEMTIGESP
ncbi:MAG: hypothetical protein D6B26_02410, partial [Spirochaetaceae bacterium]